MYLLEGVLYFFIFKEAYVSLISIDQIVLVIQAFELFNTSVSSIVESLTTCKQSITYIHELVDIIDGGDNTHHQSNRRLPLNSRNTFELEKVSFYYNNVSSCVLNGLNLNIHKNEITVILGENGSGKSTVVKMMLGMINSKQGVVREVMQDKSAIFQDFSKFFLTIKENIIVADLKRKSDNKFMEDIIMIADLNEIITKSPNHFETMLGKEYDNQAIDLSGGEWQKIAFARSLFKDAEVIILDEPTSALDPIAEENHFKKVIEQFIGKTVIIVTHRIGVTKYADNIVFMKDGNVAEAGTHKQLLNCNGLYNEFYQEQSKWYIGD